MKLIIAGSRDLNPSVDFISSAIKMFQLKNINEVVCGMAVGVDQDGFYWAIRCDISIKSMPADWNKHGKKAGPIRNQAMAEYADELLLIWDGSSKGSSNMKKNMLKLNKPVHEIIIRRVNE